jgi:hypothetical protein
MPEMKASQGSVPVPDPTKLTTDAVALAKVEIEKLFNVQLDQLRKDAAQLRQVVADVPGLERDQRDRLRELLEEKFVGVKTEFTMRDIALAAAFKAAEAAVKQQNESNTLAIDKAGTAFTKQIDSLDEKIDDLKERIAELGRKDTATDARGAGRNDIWLIIVAVGSLIIAAAAIFLRHGDRPVISERFRVQSVDRNDGIVRIVWTLVGDPSQMAMLNIVCPYDDVIKKDQVGTLTWTPDYLRLVR